MNVKPGDLAKIVSCSFPENIGRHVVVIGLPTTLHNFKAAAKMALYFKSVVWLAEPLEPVTVHKDGKYVWREPGQPVLLCDSHLRRIDPPEGWEELWKDTPVGTQVSDSDIEREGEKSET